MATLNPREMSILEKESLRYIKETKRDLGPSAGRAAVAQVRDFRDAFKINYPDAAKALAKRIR